MSAHQNVQMLASGGAMSMIDFDVERLNHKIFIRFGARLVVSERSAAAAAASNRAYCTRDENMHVWRACRVLNAVGSARYGDVGDGGLACRTD